MTDSADEIGRYLDLYDRIQKAAPQDLAVELRRIRWKTEQGVSLSLDELISIPVIAARLTKLNN